MAKEALADLDARISEVRFAILNLETHNRNMSWLRKFLIGPDLALLDMFERKLAQYEKLREMLIEYGNFDD